MISDLYTNYAKKIVKGCGHKILKMSKYTENVI